MNFWRECQSLLLLFAFKEVIQKDRKISHNALAADIEGS